jgi:CAAX prenyl protease-like protein
MNDKPAMRPNYATPPEPQTTRMTDLAYVAPMAAFLAFTWAGGKWPAFMPASYVIKTFLTAGLLFYFRKEYTRISWKYWGLGLAMGVVGLVQWVGMEEWLRAHWPNYPRIPGATGEFDPHTYFTTPLKMWSFVIIRWMGAALVVPFMEELFWRDFLWRSIIAPADFKLAKVGEWDWKAFVIVAIAFAGVHPQWIIAVTWGLMIGALLVYTRSLGACIVMHAVTNFLLGAYVQYTGKWYYW